MEIDIDSFHPSRNRPATELRNEILEITRDKVEIWLQEFIIDRKNYFDSGKFPPKKTRAFYERYGFQYTLRELHAMFQSFLKVYGYTDYRSIENVFGKKLITLTFEGFERYTSRSTYKYRLFVDKAIQTMIEKGWITEEDMVDRDEILDDVNSNHQPDAYEFSDDE